MSQTIRIVASPTRASACDPSYMPTLIANEYHTQGWRVEQLSIDGIVHEAPYRTGTNALHQEGVPVMDRDERPAPSPLWYWLGIPVCLASIIAGAWLLNEEAARRADARQAERTDHRTHQEAGK